MSRISDQELFKLVGRALDSGRLVVVARAAGAGTAPSAGSALGKFFARVARLALDKITCNGSHYRLVLWHKVNRRDVGRTFRVIPLNEAAAILDRRAAQAPQRSEEREILIEAKDHLIAPQSGTTESGLVLLGRIADYAPSAAQQGPAITPSQMRKLKEQATLEIHVVDLKGKPQAGLAFKIKTPDGSSVSGKLDKEGRGRGQSSIPGVFVVTFPDLDGADWDGDGALALPDKERSETSKYKVQQGDRLPTIARKKGFARWQTIWDFGGNAALTDLRGDAHILFPDDEVSIPSKLARAAEVQGGKAEYVVQSGAEVLRVQFAAADFWRDNKVRFKATPDKGEATEGPLETDGTMEIALPADTMKVSVDLFQDADETPFFTCTLAVGHLDPDETTSGVQARLANLGYYAGPIDGEMNDATREAVIAFRLAELGDETDVVDDAFTEALVKAHNV